MLTLWPPISRRRMVGLLAKKSHFINVTPSLAHTKAGYVLNNILLCSYLTKLMYTDYLHLHPPTKFTSRVYCFYDALDLEASPITSSMSRPKITACVCSR